jgi:FixJ family two-component response regulator
MLDSFIERDFRNLETRGSYPELLHDAARSTPRRNADRERERRLSSRSSEPIVFVIDADASTCEAIRNQGKHGGWDCKAFSAECEFLAWPKPCVPSCLVLDASIPAVDSLALQRRLAAERPAMPIVIVAAEADVAKAVQAMKAGAIEFLLKPLRIEELQGAIARAIEQSRDALHEEFDMRSLRMCHGSLTPREREVMERIVAGRLNKQVAGDLGISEITVKAHRGRVMRKMCARSFANLVRMAARLGLT